MVEGILDSTRPVIGGRRGTGSRVTLISLVGSDSNKRDGTVKEGYLWCYFEDGCPRV